MFTPADSEAPDSAADEDTAIEIDSSVDSMVVILEKVGKKVAKRLPHSTFDGIFTQ